MFSHHALNYFESGLVVIPLRGKIPVIQNWSAFAKARPSDILIESWLSKYPGFNIGLVTGKLSGVVAIDIDKDEAKSLVPLSPLVKKGKKGETRFFKYNGEVNFKRHDLGIELLSDGNQTVLPPSIHPETKTAYVWLSTDTLLNFDISDLPILPESFFNAVGSVRVLKGDVQGRHSTLLEIASAMLGRGEGIDSTIDEILKHDKENHPVPYFTDKSEPHKGRGRFAALKMVTSIAETITNKGGEIEPNRIEIVIGEDQVQKEIDSIELSKKTFTLPVPKAHVLKMIAGYTVSQSYKHRPKFALASSLGFLGTIMSNKYRFGDSTPNLYQLLVAESGEGKDVPLKMPKKLLIEGGLLQYLGLESYRGDKSIVKKFETQRERIDIIDEVSKLFRAMNSQNSTFSANIGETLTEIWNSSNDLFTGFATATETTGMVFHPCLSMLAATTPRSFSETFSDRFLMQGFGARFLYIFDDKRVELMRPHDISLPEDVKTWIHGMGSKKVCTRKTDISKMGSVHIDLSGNKPTSQIMKDLERPVATNLPLGKGLDKRLDELMKYYDELSYHVPESVRPVCLRAFQQVQKIMIIHAVAGQDFDNPAPLIQAEDIDFAHEYVEGCLKMTKSFFDDHLISSHFHRQSSIVLAILKRAAKGMTQAELTAALVRNFKSTELYDKKTGIVTALVDAQKIIEFKVEGKGRPMIKYIYNWKEAESES